MSDSAPQPTESAVASAAKGAAQGGVAGAVTAVGKTAWKNPKTRRIIIGISTTLALFALVGPILFTILVTQSVTGMFNANNNETSSRAAAADGVTSEQITAAYSNNSTNVPAELHAWFLKNRPEFTNNLGTLGEQIALALPERGMRSLLVGTGYQQDVGIVELDDERSKELVEQSKQGFVTALTSEQFTDDNGTTLDKATAETAYQKAREWALGNNNCGSTSSTEPGTVSGSESTSVPGASSGWAQLDTEQTQIAKDIIGATNTYLANATQAQRERAGLIALSNAMRESTLRNVNHGDSVGPDSRGIFQQRDHWGPESKRMTPTWATMKFLSVLVTVENWDTIAQEQASIKVQVFADAHLSDQVEMFELAKPLYNELKNTASNVPVDPEFGQWPSNSTSSDANKSGTNTGTTPPSTGSETTCVQSGPVVAGDFVSPMPEGSWVNDPYGMRTHPVSGVRRKHTGADMLAPGGTCGAPLHAVTNATVTEVFYSDGWGNAVAIKDAAGVTYFYAHIEDGGTKVKEGDTVKTGQVIALAGTTGPSTGCHLHFEVRPDGTQENSVDPVPYLKDRGVALEVRPDS